MKGHALALGLLALVARPALGETAARAALLLDADEELVDKKSQWLSEKASRAEGPVPAAAREADHPVTLRNLWTHELLALPASLSTDEAQAAFDRLVRCHYTQVATRMAPRLLDVVRAAAAAFRAPLVELVSGYRAPKYQLMLRKKGHEVARDSAHPRGEAVDFRLPEVPTLKLLAFVRKHRTGGIGYYPDSRFVHVDVGPVRSWRGH